MFTPAIGVAGILGRTYKTIRLEWSSEFRLLRVRTSVRPIQCYSLAAMSELQLMLSDISANPGLVRHFVMTSDVPSVFSFGGDLALFVLLVRAGDKESLQLYGRRCIELVWWMENAANLGVHTTVLSQGDTLGGGLESVLPFHKVIFERRAQGGFPEVLFNLFPGMGAWDFTIRRAGFDVANEMILSGRLYSAEELHVRHMVDVVADDGQGEAAIDRVIRDVDPRHRGTLAALRAQRLAAPIRYETLLAIVDQWAEAALGLTDRDLRLMERLARAQARKAGGAEEGAVEEIKRMELENAWGEGHRRTGVDRRGPISEPLEPTQDRRAQEDRRGHGPTPGT
ncbi:crotonase/enoyl-CoA hydratase family protein [Aquabacterium sp.]|uniref:crotonase/enoyl-CoA hydratase family protein n=1 Tax=Aquabacterium sp. TaxID=1872578 RepID=UPI002BF49AD0|nr:crotonase/enoyl-CoA hydratase family protein [Aquabacterium sp.]HSW06871.1 crotonase/enoyl-CoA hydratase family protein [Aquabacterium sp.]